jgi:TPR repeat protein
MYAKGRGVPQNFYEAAHWYYLAAQRGHGGAQFELGLMYNKGEGLRRDFVLAYFWLNLSASQAIGDDRNFKAGIRDAVASKMTVEQVAVAQEMVTAWYQRR